MVVQFEVRKLLQRKSSLVILAVTAIVFPFLVKVTSSLNAAQNGTAGEDFAAQVAYGIISFSQSYFFIPVWIFLFAASEFVNGHANRVSFELSKKFYFRAKIAYCVLVSLLFAVLGVLSLVWAMSSSTTEGAQPGGMFVLAFFAQMFVSSLIFSLLLMALVFVVQAQVMGFVIYLGWSLFEVIAFTVAKGLYEVPLYWLPLHLMRLTYTLNGDAASGQYYSWVDGPHQLIVLPLAFVLLVGYFTYTYFMNKSLKPLSD